jgi:short-subunit dehydrogenase involved in D-alanine esterification of teichoic acids
MELKDKKVFITGGTRGIGFELAKLLSQEGSKVVIGGRNQQKLREISEAYPHIGTIFFDALSKESYSKVGNQLLSTLGGLDILINNAAVLYSGNFTESTFNTETIETEVSTNVTAPIMLIKVLLPLLTQPHETAIVNITSGVAYMPMPTLPVYSATKAALQSFTISLRYNLAQTKIKVFEALPPLVATEMTENLPGKAKAMTKMTPQKCASSIIKGIKDDRQTIDIGSSKSLYIGRRLFPSIVQNQLNKM